MNHTFLYRLDSSILPPDRAYQTVTDWGGTDQLNTEYDQYLGNWAVYASRDLYRDGQVLAAKGEKIAGSGFDSSKFGGNLVLDGGGAWMFKMKAVFIVEKETFDDEDALIEIVLDAGAEDMKAEDEVFEITAEPAAFDDIEKALGEKGVETASAEVTMVPDTTVHLAGKDAEKMQNLIDALEENDDVQNVYSNYESDDEE